MYLPGKTKIVAGVLIALIVGVVAGYFIGDYLGYEKGKASTDMWNTIEKRGYIRVASSPDLPPFEYSVYTPQYPTTAEFTGFEVDILEEVMRRLGREVGETIRVDWVSMDFATIEKAVVAKTVDLGVRGFTITPEGSEAVQYCTPHSVSEGQIIAVKGTASAAGVPPEGLRSVQNLTTYGFTCGVESETRQEDELIAAGITPVIFGDYLAAIDDMVAGGVDTIYAETPLTYHWIETYGGKGYELEIIFRKLYWPVAFIAHHDSDVLVAKISGQIAALISEGWIEGLEEEYGMAN